MPAQRIEILGVPVDCVDWTGALAAVNQLLQDAGPARAVVAVNPEKIMRARQDATLLLCLRGAALLFPDGIGVIVASRLLRLGRMERVAGCELMPGICELAARRGERVFLLGASPSVNQRAAAELQLRYPSLCIAGRRDGYFDDTQLEQVTEAINASRATILFVALGSPRQELWMQRCLPLLSSVKVCQGVGGTFDVLAGTVRRAPPAFIRLNLEWLYRLLSEPRRLLRQRALPHFAVQVLGQSIASSVNGHARNARER